MTILYITYVDVDFVESGSGLRPRRMLEELRSTGHKLIELTGSQVRKERCRRVREVSKQIEQEAVDICYIESPTYPIMQACDRRLIRKIHRMGIPIGYFYRDFYRRFPDIFPRRTSFTGRIKEWGLDVLQWLTDRVLQCCDIVYVPSEACKAILPYKTIKALPPAAPKWPPTPPTLCRNGIYVGGVGGPYDVSYIIGAFRLLYEENAASRLILVCRKAEWDTVKSRYEGLPYLEVHHASGEALEALYARASVAFNCPDVNNPYNRFGVATKVFEYLSHGLPVVSVNVEAMGKIIRDNHFGIVVDNTEEAFAEAVRKLWSDEETYRQQVETLAQSIKEHHLWKHRVEQVINDLSAIKKP